jgi:ribosomal protein S24E
VRNECLEYALKNDEQFGIWGGTSQRERKRYMRQRRREADGTVKHMGRTPNPEITKRDKEICEARSRNVSVDELSEKYGLSVNTIYRISGRVRRERREAEAGVPA